MKSSYQRSGFSGQRLALGGWLLASGQKAIPHIRRHHSSKEGRLPIANWQKLWSWLLAVVQRTMAFVGRERSSKKGQRLTASSQWLRCNRADLVWSSVVLVAVLLPLASLTLDVPRYFVLRSRLQLAADAAAEAAAQCVDIPHFQATGETLPDYWCAYSEPESVFRRSVAPLRAKGYGLYVAFIGIDPAQQSVSVYAQGDMPVFFALTPRLTVRVEARSAYRVVVK